MRLGLTQRRQRIETAAAKLSQLNPRLVLSRGYAIVLKGTHEIVREAAAAPAGTELKILFAESELKAVTTG